MVLHSSRVSAPCTGPSLGDIIPACGLDERVRGLRIGLLVRTGTPTLHRGTLSPPPLAMSPRLQISWQPVTCYGSNSLDRNRGKQGKEASRHPVTSSWRAQPSPGQHPELALSRDPLAGLPSTPPAPANPFSWNGQRSSPPCRGGDLCPTREKRARLSSASWSSKQTCVLF